MKKAAETEGRRKTLVDRQNETQIADPAAHAKKQVSELDKTAKRSLDKRKKCTENIEKDKKELAHIESQINRINTKYVQLCSSLQEARDKRDYLLQVLDTCVCDEKQIMGKTKTIVQDRKMDDSKLMRKMATMELQMLRGYDMGASSTFQQSGKMSMTNTLANTGASTLK